MSTPSSAIASMASGLTDVASVPALATSKRSPARCRRSPSAIWDRAELWVHRNSTLCRAPLSAIPTIPVYAEVIRDASEEARRLLAVEGVEAPPPPPLLAYQPGLFELAHVVGDPGLAHPEGALELADADPRRVAFAANGRAEVRQAAAPASLGGLGGQHPEHLRPDRVRERPPQRDHALYPLFGRTGSE